MKVSLWHRSTESIILLTLSVALLLPPIPAGALDGAYTESLVDSTEAVVVDDSAALEGLPDEAVAPQELVSSVAQQDVSDSPSAEEAPTGMRSMIQSQVDDGPTPSIRTEPSPIQPNDSILISSLQVTDGAVDFVQLYNTDKSIVGVSDLSIVVIYHATQPQDSDIPCVVGVDGYMLSGNHLLIADRSVSGENVYPLDVCGGVSSDAITVELRRTNAVHPVVNPDGVIERMYLDGVYSASTKNWIRTTFTASKRTGVMSKDYSTTSPAVTLEADALYQPPDSPKLDIVEMLPSALACPVSDARLECSTYVKVVNDSDELVDLSIYRLRGGEMGVSATKSNTSELNGSVAAHSFAIINRDKYGDPLALNKSAGTIWFEDVYGVKAYKNSVMPYEKANTVAWRGKVWAYDATSATWKWGLPSPKTLRTSFAQPYAAGIVSRGSVSSLRPCAADQFRNPATNRCKKIVSTTSTLKSCSAGEYRNPSTNRCKKLATTSTTLKACAADEFRNPATNRCKKVASTTSTLQPCKSGYERNPETNRCRKVGVAGASASMTDFPVEPVKDSAKAFVGWWALGGLLILGAGYATWEWRHELASAMKAVGAKYSSGKGK